MTETHTYGIINHGITLADYDGLASACLHFYYDNPSEILLSSLLVDKRERGKGRGRAMLKAQERRAAQLGANIVHLWCERDSWQYRWYQRCGYEVTGEHIRQGYVWMSKPIIPLPSGVI